MRTSLKKSRQMTMENVLGNDALLMEILVRLPPKFVFRFRCVSKRWNNILLDPYFHEIYRARTRKWQLTGATCCGGRLLAFVQVRERYSYPALPASHPFINLLPVVPKCEYKCNGLPRRFGEFVNSSGGLILSYDKGRYFVVNPMTRTWVQLPESNTRGLQGMGLVCEENKQELVPSFKVVGIVGRIDTRAFKTLEIETYSSRTKEWITSTLVCSEEIRGYTGCCYVFVCNGVFYWYTGLPGERILIYDSKRAENCVQLIKPPCLDHLWPGAFHWTLTKPYTDDFLWVGMRNFVRDTDSNGYRQIIKFWKIPMDEHGTITEDQWILVHTMDTASVLQEMRSLDAKASFLSLEVLIPSNPIVAVLGSGPKAFLYNIESKSLELVRYHGRSYGKQAEDSSWRPFVEPFCLSTYGPLANAYE